jgi:hypothetical protein
MKARAYRGSRYALTISLFFGMFVLFLLNYVVGALIVFGLGFAILQIVNAKYQKEL